MIGQLESIEIVLLTKLSYAYYKYLYILSQIAIVHKSQYSSDWEGSHYKEGLANLLQPGLWAFTITSQVNQINSLVWMTE